MPEATFLFLTTQRQSSRKVLYFQKFFLSDSAPACYTIPWFETDCLQSVSRNNDKEFEPMKNFFEKSGRTLLLLLLLFLAFAGCLFFNTILENKIQRQQSNTLQTIYDVFHPEESSPSAPESSSSDAAK